MAASEVDICNLALGLLGAERISALSEDDNCYTQYPICRDACLEDMDWSFAISRFVLSAPDADAPAFGYSYRYLVPTDVLRIIEVNGNEYPWELEGGYILTDEASCNVKAVVRVTDVRQFSDSFCQALAARLASVLAIPVTNSKGMVEAALNIYDGFKAAAKVNDGRQGSNRKIVRKDIRMRHGI